MLTNQTYLGEVEEIIATRANETDKLIWALLLRYEKRGRQTHSFSPGGQPRKRTNKSIQQDLVVVDVLANILADTLGHAPTLYLVAASEQNKRESS